MKRNKEFVNLFNYLGTDAELNEDQLAQLENIRLLPVCLKILLVLMERGNAFLGQVSNAEENCWHILNTSV